MAWDSITHFHRTKYNYGKYSQPTIIRVKWHGLHLICVHSCMQQAVWRCKDENYKDDGWWCAVVGGCIAWFHRWTELQAGACCCPNSMFQCRRLSFDFVCCAWRVLALYLGEPRSPTRSCFGWWCKLRRPWWLRCPWCSASREWRAKRSRSSMMCKMPHCKHRWLQLMRVSPMGMWFLLSFCRKSLCPPADQPLAKHGTTTMLMYVHDSTAWHSGTLDLNVCLYVCLLITLT